MCSYVFYLCALCNTFESLFLMFHMQMNWIGSQKSVEFISCRNVTFCNYDCDCACYLYFWVLRGLMCSGVHKTFLFLNLGFILMTLYWRKTKRVWRITEIKALPLKLSLKRQPEVRLRKTLSWITARHHFCCSTPSRRVLFSHWKNSQTT